MQQQVERVVVIGSGGIGHCLLPTLCRVLNFGSSLEEYNFDDGVELHLVDGDDYEERNRDRQGFHRRGNKAEVTIEPLREEFPNLEMQSHPLYVTEDNAPLLIRDNDVVFLCVDNHKTRKLISEFCEELESVTLISGGNDLEDGNVMVYVRRDDENVTLPLTSIHPSIKHPDDEHPDEVERTGGCEEQAEAAPQLLIANNQAAACMLNSFHAFLRGKFEPEAKVMKIGNKELPNQSYYSEVFFDIVTGQSQSRWVKNPLAE